MTVLKVCFALALMFSTQQAFGQEKSIRIAVEGAFAPYNYKDSSGQLVGFEIDLIPDLCTRMNTECSIIEQSWSGIIPGLQTGKYDAIVSSMTVTEQRKQAVLFSDEYAVNFVGFATLKSNPLSELKTNMEQLDLAMDTEESKKDIQTLVAALQGKTVGVNRSTTNELLAKHLLGDDGATIRTYDNSENVALDLMSGRVDAVVISRAQLGLLIKRDDNVVGFGPRMHGGILGGGMAAAVRHDNQELADSFSEAIAGAVADGTIEKLSVKWLGYDVTPR